MSIYKHLGILIAALLSLPALANEVTGNELLVPVASRAAGAYGSQWRTDLTVTNTASLSTEPVMVRLVFNRTDGRIDEVAVPIAPRESFVAHDVVRELFGAEAGVGTIRIFADNAYTRLTARARVYNIGSGQGEYGQTVPALSTTGLGLVTLLPGLSGMNGNRTNVGIANPSDQSVDLFISLFDQYGEFHSGFSTVVKPRGLLLVNDALSQFAVGVLENAMIQVNSTRGVYAYASIVRADSGDADFVTGIAIE
ncbi:MAG: hypothetical protein JOZ54_17905 [Acidobacteria bacterium]|nr:hypothetical protein [Acidobacteriota bacterium]